MQAAVDLDHETLGEAGEVGDVPANRKPSAELVVIELPAAQQSPHLSFDIR